MCTSTYITTSPISTHMAKSCSWRLRHQGLQIDSMYVVLNGLFIIDDACMYKATSLGSP